VSTSDFETWAAEIEGELAGALADLAAAKVDLVSAQTARDEASAEERRVGAVLDSLAGQGAAGRLWGTPQPGLSPFLAGRRDPPRRAAHAAEGALTQAKLHVGNLERRVEDAREALAAIETATNPANEGVING
jgi:hypothetical protein